MSSDKNTTNDLRLTGQDSEYDPILNLLRKLSGSGEYLVRAIPSSVPNKYFSGLEETINSLYTEIDTALTSGGSRIDQESLITLRTILENELFPPISEWVDFANAHPEIERPGGLFKNIKPIGRIIRDLYKRI